MAIYIRGDRDKKTKLSILTQVDFPAVTICSTGTAKSNVKSAFYDQFLTFLAEKGLKVDIPAKDFELVLTKVKATFYTRYQQKG